MHIATVWDRKDVVPSRFQNSSNFRVGSFIKAHMLHDITGDNEIEIVCWIS